MASENVAKSPLEHVWRQFVPQGHDQALRNAFYNVAAGVFIVGAAAAAWSVYLILQPFVRALMWAVLCGSVLHPLKHKLATSVRKWLYDVQETESLLSLSVLFTPISFLDSLSEFVGCYVVAHMKEVIVVTVVLPIFYIIIHHTPTFISHLVYSVGSFNYYIIKYFLEFISFINYFVWILIVAYFIMVMVHPDPKTLRLLKKISLPMWMLSVASLSSMWSTVSVPLFIILTLLLFGGLWMEVKDKNILNSGKKCNLFSSFWEITFGSDCDSSQDNKEENKSSVEDSPSSKESVQIEELKEDLNTVSEPTLNVPRPDDLGKSASDVNNENVSSSSESEKQKTIKESKKYENATTTTTTVTSNYYLKGLLIACILVELWRHSYLLSLLPLSLVYYAVKKVTSLHLFGEGVELAKDTSYKKFNYWYESKRKVLLPLPLRGVFKLLKSIDIKIVRFLVDGVDSVVTIFIMLAMLIFCIMIFIFLAVQIQGEGMHMITMGSQLVNATIVHNPQFHELLPEGIDEFVNSALDNGYLYGRDWISNLVRSMLGETKEEKAKEIEAQVIQLWDRIYQAWVVSHPEPPFHSPIVNTEAVAMTLDSIIDGLIKTPGLISFTALSDIVKENLGTVMSVLKGVWTILLSNLSLAISALTATSSLLLGGSLSILNALLNMIVFLSALFYILSVSDSVYKPVGILGGLAPGQMNTLGATVTESVNGVFIASFKMGAFYGMWTWLLHIVFGTHIVYIPAVLSALFGAVPLVGTYWAAVPGCLELFWGHGSPFLALSLFIFQLLPMMIIDTTFYSEIKGGGHPYLTGLAVAGGIFCWGVEGAILGPLLLCILLVVTKMYSSLIQSPSDVASKFKKFRRCQSEYMSMY